MIIDDPAECDPSRHDCTRQKGHQFHVIRNRVDS